MIDVTRNFRTPFRQWHQAICLQVLEVLAAPLWASIDMMVIRVIHHTTQRALIRPAMFMMVEVVPLVFM